MCGIIAVFNTNQAVMKAQLGLHALQHRGEEAVGFAAEYKGSLRLVKKRGLVGDSLLAKDIEQLGPARVCIGHVRYSTTGGPRGHNTQPLFASLPTGEVALAHNGQISNYKHLRYLLESRGSIFQTSSDSEIILHLMAASDRPTIIEKLTEALNLLQGSFSLILLSKEGVIIARDEKGIRPLCVGVLPCGGLVVASESCALPLIGAEHLGEITPGSVFYIQEVNKFISSKKVRPCLFEKIYFARPDSVIDGDLVYTSRINLGRELAKESPVEADVVFPVPDSGTEAAIGFSRESGIPFDRGLLRSHYLGRTFIQPTEELRNNRIYLKLSPVKEVVKDKRVVVIDDSIVRGNTVRRITNMLKGVGAKEVHIRITSPPIVSPCYYGIDIKSSNELIASSKSIEEIRHVIGCDSLAYLSLEKTKQATNLETPCDACFTKNYLYKTKGET